MGVEKTRTPVFHDFQVVEKSSKSRESRWTKDYIITAKIDLQSLDVLIIDITYLTNDFEKP